MTQNDSLLQSAFAQTDTIRHGPFTVIKTPGAPWRQAHAFVDDMEVTIPPQQKLLLALLISQKGAAVTMDTFAAEAAAPHLRDGLASESPLTKAVAYENVANVMKVQMSMLRRNLTEQGVSPDTLALIDSANPKWHKGEKGKKTPGMRAAYYLKGPSE